jgi:hypothetical protein
LSRFRSLGVAEQCQISISFATEDVWAIMVMHDHGAAQNRRDSVKSASHIIGAPSFSPYPLFFKGALPGLPPLRIVQQAALLENVADAVNTRFFLPAGMFSEDAKNRWPFYLLSIVLG